MSAHDNKAFIGDNPSSIPHYTTTNGHTTNGIHIELAEAGNCRLEPDETDTTTKTPPERDAWGNQLEFLMSCIAMSVGLGNVWRFPFTALENGGGAFLIPYLIVLFVVGKPIYYMEMLIGQFSSRGCAKVYDLCPAMRGVGYGQVISIGIVSTYYVALMALTLKYFVLSFHSTLPWSQCASQWGELCTDSGSVSKSNFTNGSRSSADLFFVKEVLKEKDNIDDGIGVPDWSLAICLIISWTMVVLTLVKGVQSSGKASYFLAIFPYIVMTILLIRAVTLEGAMNGIIYFITPQWDQILNPKVWYAAVTQVFFSLSVCFGNIIMYSSYNKFTHNIKRDANIVTYMDTFTSLLAGCTIFGILGHLAFLTGNDDIGSVVQGGTGLAFISYPDAIAKFDFIPQVFSVLFFLMLFVLGIGSNIAMTSCVMTVIRDQFPKVKCWHAAVSIGVIGTCLGLVYITPGGQFILNLVDFFGASLIAFVLAIAELICIGWIYGVNRLCRDVEFMLGQRTGLYWRICWGVVTPLLMIAILIYTIVTYEPLMYKNTKYPNAAYACGWIVSALGILQLPIWAFYAIVKQDGNTLLEKIQGAFRPRHKWGPRDAATLEKYQKFIDTENEMQLIENAGVFRRMKRNVFG